MLSGQKLLSSSPQTFETFHVLACSLQCSALAWSRDHNPTEQELMEQLIQSNTLSEKKVLVATWDNVSVMVLTL